MMRLHDPGNDTGIRGPELSAADAIAVQIARQDRAALCRYARGLIAVIVAWKLLAIRQRLATRSAERDFLIRRLELLEQRHPQAVAAALARQRPPAAVPALPPDDLDGLCAALRLLGSDAEHDDGV